jgi:hypothetical protein
MELDIYLRLVLKLEMERNIKSLFLVVSRHIKNKSKAFPLQAWRGPWGFRSLRLQNF